MYQVATVDRFAAARPAGAAGTGCARLDDFVADVETRRRTHGADRPMADAVATRLARLLADPDWLPDCYRVPADDGYRSHVVHVSPDGGWSLVSLVWKPGQRTPIHDHVSWCVVGVYRGEEEETRYRLYAREDERFLVGVDRHRAPAGTTVALVPPDEDIHAVANAGNGIAISLHVYGADIGALGSSINHRFDDLPVRADPGPHPPASWRQVFLGASR